MGPRPPNLNLRDDPVAPPPRAKHQFYMDLPSPRAGEIPPALSPLDAFAMQSRALAKRFNDPSQTGRRISRLPHMDVAKELGNRPGYPRGASDDGSTGEMSDVPEEGGEHVNPPSPSYAGVGVQIAGGEEGDRPMSHYPVLGNNARESAQSQLSAVDETPTEYFDAPEGPTRPPQQDYFGVAAPRASSPEPVSPKMVNVQAASPLNLPSLTNSVDSVQSTPQTRTFTHGSTRSQRSLAPPRSPAFPKSPRSMHSIRSVPPDSGDEDAGSVNEPLSLGAPRKLSGSSNMSRPQSPYSPWTQPPDRSPSALSEHSPNAPPRRTNFSRPLSSGGSRTRPALPDARPSFESRSSIDTRPSTEIPFRPSPAETYAAYPPSNFLPKGLPHRQGSSESYVAYCPPNRQNSNESYVAYNPSNLSSGLSSRQHSQDDVQTPIPTSIPARPVPHSKDLSTVNPATSYIYAKYALPRGRPVDRDSFALRESWIHRQFNWDEPMAAPTAPLPLQQPTTLPPRDFRFPNRPASPAGSVKAPQEERVGRARAQSSANRSRSADPRSHYASPAPPPTTASSPSYAPAVQKPASIRTQHTHSTTSTDRTLKPSHSTNPSLLSSHTHKTSIDLSPEEHLEVGIQSHDAGALTKSTYHLRLAARAGLPTAMLLYGLACRHGWGMRPNPTDGVVWLRKAIESAGVEVADVDAAAAPSLAGGAAGAPQERKKRKAQFALAIYELGISYMNGWGCAKDKALAVRCYEVAGSWGDCDALAEAGFCYTQGVGVRRDYKKAAGLYRKAAEGGMGMAGNSWIYKPKYMDSSSSSTTSDAPTSGGLKDSSAIPLPSTSTDKSPSKKAARAAAAANPTPDFLKDAPGDDFAGAKPPQTRQRSRSLWSRKPKG